MNKFKTIVVEHDSEISVGTSLSFNKTSKILTYLVGTPSGDILGTLNRLRPTGNFHTLELEELVELGVNVNLKHLTLTDNSRLFELIEETIFDRSNNHIPEFRTIRGITEASHLATYYESDDYFKVSNNSNLEYPTILENCHLGLNNSVIVSMFNGEVDMIIPINSDPGVKIPVLKLIFP